MASRVTRTMAATATAVLAATTTLVGWAPTTGTVSALSSADIVGPPGSEQFGYAVIVLGNGNFVVSDPRWDSPTNTDVGQVSLYDGTTLELLGRVHGTTDGDEVGIGGIHEVGDSDFVIGSPNWDHGDDRDAGAVTWVDGKTGLDAPVSATNSLVGGFGAQLGLEEGITVLANGNYAVTTFRGVSDETGGSTTWGPGNGGVVGPVSAANSLLGLGGDLHGESGVAALGNGSYVVYNPRWGDFRGMARWVAGDGPTTGVVSPANSLVGATDSDAVGVGGVVPLANGNYVVLSPYWGAADLGAVTWRDGTRAQGAVVSAANSLVGTAPDDQVGGSRWSWNWPGGATALSNGNYVVASPGWGPGELGAVTWGDGTRGVAGAVSAANSLVGATASDHAGGLGVTALTNGNYVVNSPWQSPEWYRPGWDEPYRTTGAVTWADGTRGLTGPISATNSLIATEDGSSVGEGGVTALANGNYVVASPGWNGGDGGLALGAVTWADGAHGLVGGVTAAGSIVGGSSFDGVGSGGVTPLADGNYVVASPQWTNYRGLNADFGAATWGDGSRASSLVVGPTNSLVGGAYDAEVGSTVTALANGDYIVGGHWVDVQDNVGHFEPTLTWADGQGDTAGTATPVNSLVIDEYNTPQIIPQEDSTSAVLVPYSEYTTAGGRGSVTFAGRNGAVGQRDAGNSVFGTPTGYNSGDIVGVATGYTTGGALVLIRTPSNRVTLMTPTPAEVDAPAPPRDLVPLLPARLLDTRPEQATVDGQFAAHGRLAAGQAVELTVAGRGGVATSAVALSLNVTAADTGEPGFVTVYPCGEPRPNASNLNYPAGATTPNAVIAKIGTDGKVCLYSSAATDLVVDANGYAPAGSAYHALNPARLLDTRPGFTTADGLAAATDHAGAASTTVLQVAGRGGVPDDAAAVVLNVAATAPEAPGFVTVYPCGGEVPVASSLNYLPGETIPNLVVSKLGPGGTVCLHTFAASDLVVDVNGYLPATSSYTALVPARLFDTRAPSGGGQTVDGLFAGDGYRNWDEVTELDVRERGAVGPWANTVVLNVTVVSPSGFGFVTVYPCGDDPPLASNLNYSPNQTVANAVVTPVSAEGLVCLYTLVGTHLIADVTGFLP